MFQRHVDMSQGAVYAYGGGGYCLETLASVVHIMVRNSTLDPT